MAQPGFSVDQLMELAGLAVAMATQREFAVERFRRVLVVAGPGNNGGDGLVAARHLFHWGYSPRVFYPRPSRSNADAARLFGNLVKQLEDLDVPVVSDGTVPSAKELDEEADVVLDAVFGFSFKGPVKAPFDAAIAAMRDTRTPVVSVDIPSGWDVDDGPAAAEKAFMPAVLVSLTAPKPAAAHFRGRAHYIGGRFVPPALARKYGIADIASLYRGSDQIADVSGEPLRH
jgi:NAD(P)H-hydrate epimerase